MTSSKSEWLFGKEIGERIGYGAGNYAAYDARFIVSPKRVPAVMKAALAECRRLTLQHITMPPDESVELEYVVHKPWSAFSSYKGNNHSVIEVNLELPLTVDRLLDLACHEGYPGHHVFNTLRDQSVVKRMGFREGQVQLTFSPQSFVSEAAASYAPEMVLDEPTRIQIERNLLFPAAGLKTDDVERYIHVQRLIESLHSAEPGIAREYLDGRLEFVRALGALEHELLMEHGESTLLYLNEYRSYMLTYTVGKDLVERCVEQGAKEPVSRWMRYQKLMTQPENNLSYCAHHV
ncbi:MAG: hypothetical protein PW789_01740 [Edaphobacter sp.]|uniref:hypothetical protein n=1 Tax=Edaphobacter sp. TaxID=1934404 RepID=UPI0023A1DA5F|nr:hypothetical protein [Edaphobacter sp.]MDE1175311.1 hypothetical protein [Edaphobacter sp.]